MGVLKSKKKTTTVWITVFVCSTFYDDLEKHDFIRCIKTVVRESLEFYRFGHIYHNLQPRVMKTFLHSFLDPTKALPQHYGAIKGIEALGSRRVCFDLRVLILGQ